MKTVRELRIGQIGTHPTVAFAVGELVRTIKRMDPELMISVLQADTVVQALKRVIWVGMDASFASSVPAVQDPLLDDAISISIHGHEGFVTGSNPRSVLIASYRLLRELGCAWVRPGSEGERIPAREIESIDVSVAEKASSRHRGVCIEGSNAYENIFDMIDFLPKVGMNAYFFQFMAPYTFFARWYHHEQNPHIAPQPFTREDALAMTRQLEAEMAKRGILNHKAGHGWTCEPFGIEGNEWSPTEVQLAEEQTAVLAEVNGKRELWGGIPLNTNLCYSNPDVRSRMTDAIVDYCRTNPQVDLLHFWLADGSNNHCECEKCREQRPSDWYVTLLNELDAKMTQAGLDTKIVFLIYVDLLWAPETATIEHPERFVLMFAPITRLYGEHYGDCLTFDGALAPYDRNHLTMPKSLSENLARLRDWQKVFHGDSFAYDYHLMWAHVNDPGYERCARNLFDDMRDLSSIGLNGMVSCQVQRCFFPTALPFIGMAAALWNADSDFEEVADHWYRDAFGERGGEVRHCLKTISDQFTRYNSPPFEPAEASETACVSDPGIVRQTIKTLQKLASENNNAGGACGEEWRTLTVFCEYVARLTDAMEHVDKGETGQAKVEGRSMLNWLDEQEMSIQKTFDVHNVRRVINGQLQLTD